MHFVVEFLMQIDVELLFRDRCVPIVRLGEAQAGKAFLYFLLVVVVLLGHAGLDPVELLHHFVELLIEEILFGALL